MFQWDEFGNYKFEKVEEIDRELTVTNHVGIREALELVEASTGKETLGMCLAPDGNINDEMKRLTKKSGHGQVISA